MGFPVKFPLNQYIEKELVLEAETTQVSEKRPREGQAGCHLTSSISWLPKKW